MPGTARALHFVCWEGCPSSIDWLLYLCPKPVKPILSQWPVPVLCWNRTLLFTVAMSQALCPWDDRSTHPPGWSSNIAKYFYHSRIEYCRTFFHHALWRVQGLSVQWCVDLPGLSWVWATCSRSDPSQPRHPHAFLPVML